MAHFGEFLGHDSSTPPNMVRLAETFTTGSTKEYKNSVWWIFEKIQIFPETGDTQSLMVWIGENKKIQDKNSGYPDLSTPTS